MKKNRWYLRLLALLVLCGALNVTITAAAEAGSSDDPLVTLSYLNETFMDSIMERVDQKIAARNAQLGISAGSGASAASNFTVVTLTSGQVLTGDIGCTIISGNSRGTFAIITVRALCQSGVIIAGKGVCHRSIGVHLTKHLAFGEFREAAVILNGGCFFIRLVHRGQQLIQIAAISRHISLRFIRGRSVLHGNRGLRCGIFLLKQFFFLGCHK